MYILELNATYDLILYILIDIFLGPNMGMPGGPGPNMGMPGQPGSIPVTGPGQAPMGGPIQPPMGGPGVRPEIRDPRMMGEPRMVADPRAMGPRPGMPMPATSQTGAMPRLPTGLLVCTVSISSHKIVALKIMYI